MGLETATYINSLNSTNPADGDPVSQGDDHIRLIKSAVKATFPNITGAVSLTHAQINALIDILTSPTISSPTINKGYTEETNVANTGAAYTIDLDDGSVHILTLTADCSFTFPTPTAGRSFMLLLKQDGTGGWEVNWAAEVIWPGDEDPVITSTPGKTDKFVFTADGTYWFGSASGNNYP